VKESDISTVHSGRFTSRIEGPFVVFLIGFRINRVLAVNKWLSVGKAMGPMMAELYADPSLGFLSGFTSFYWRGAMITQYWRSFDHLIAYAHSRNATHLPAWKAFNQSIGSDGTVGVWHETYQVANGQSECIYANMPLFGLAVAGTHEPATGHLRDAINRMDPTTPQQTPPA
jgi:Domain of unknown function (DUF4188)